MSRARTNKRGSLNHQINKRMQEMNCIGQSRYIAKQEAKETLGYANNRTVGIHSYKTYDTYKSTCKQFVIWAKDTEQGIRNIEDVKEQHIKDFIKDRYEEGYSSYTYSKDLAALNKVFNTHITKSDCDVANRSYKNIENNREMKEHHSHINYNNYSSEITMIQATGMRRSNLEKVTPNTFNYNSEGLPTQIRLCDERKIGGADWSEKGGRDRVVNIPEEYQERVKEIIDYHKEMGKLENTPIFEHVPDRLGTHRFRQEFAETVYKNYIEQHGESVNYRGYDRDAVEYTSKQLGHNRLDVVIYNYLSAR